MTQRVRLSLVPDPGRARAWRMVRAATAQELRITLRNGEQLLLAFIIPVAALIGLCLVDVGDIAGARVDTVTPGIFALAVMSAAFTSQAIVTGFDRRYGVLARLAATGFPRWLLLASKCWATAAVVAAQIVILAVVASVGFGWRPPGGTAGWAVAALLAGTAAFVGLALLVGGLLRAEAVLAAANLIWLALVAVGGVLLPLDSGPTWLRVLGEATPAGALSQALRASLTDGLAPAPVTFVILGVWVVIGWAGTVRWFRWH